MERGIPAVNYHEAKVKLTHLLLLCAVLPLPPTLPRLARFPIAGGRRVLSISKICGRRRNAMLTSPSGTGGFDTISVRALSTLICLVCKQMNLLALPSKRNTWLGVLRASPNR